MGSVLFLGVGLLVSALNARLLRAQRHAEAAAAELRREVDERREAEAGVFRAQRDGRMVECSDASAHLLGASSARATSQPGTGLGLLICRHLVEAHGGRIWAESEPGRGSRFAFRLPRQARVAQGHAADAETRT